LIPLFCDLMSLLESVKRENPGKYFEEIQAYFLLLRKDDSKIPNDDEVREALMESKDFYKGPYCKKILLGLERYNRKEWIDSEGLSIEHIMPQNPLVPQVWKEELGIDYLGIKERKCHNLGNLTLTGYNSELSDKSFSEKKLMVNGLGDSQVNLNRYFMGIGRWDEGEIIKRCEILSDLFNLVYFYPSLDDSLLESYKTREIERIFYFDNHREVYDYLVDRLDLVNAKKNVFSNKVVFDNCQIKFNKKSISISDSDDDDSKIIIKNKSDVDRYLKSSRIIFDF